MNVTKTFVVQLLRSILLNEICFLSKILSELTQLSILINWMSLLTILGLLGVNNSFEGL